MARVTPSSRATGLTTSTGVHSGTVSIPSGAVEAVVAFCYYNVASAADPISVTLDGQTATFIASQAVNTTDNVAIYKVKNFSTGASKTLSWNNNSGSAYSVLEAAIEYRDKALTYGASGAAGTGSTPGTATTSSLANSSGDIILSAYSVDVTTISGFGSGQSNLDQTDDATGNLSYGFTTETGTGSSDAQAVTGNHAAIASVVFTEASGVSNQGLMMLGVGS
jgi:hypothetical protein